jgi:hypothetical protein
MPKRKGNTRKPQSTRLEDLPDSDDQADMNELEMLTSILDVNETNPHEYNRLKFVFFATAVFVFLSLPFTERVIELAAPMTSTSWLVLLVVKTMIFFILYYIIVYSN